MEYPDEKCLHDLFISAAKLTPKRLAIVDGPVRLSMGQVDVLSDRLCSHLMAIGIQTGEVVGIFMERSWQYMVRS